MHCSVLQETQSSRSLCGSRDTAGFRWNQGISPLDVRRDILVLQFHRVTAVMAKGKHPVPFRTRKLSSSAPMVLQGGPRGRVGRRRTCLKRVAPVMVERPSSLVWVVLKLEAD